MSDSSMKMIYGRKFIKCLSETTTGEDIFNEVMQYFNNKNIPLTNLINIESGGDSAMTGKVKGFISRMKSVAPHIFHIHCVIHRQHLIARNIGGDMEGALNTAILLVNLWEPLINLLMFKSQMIHYN